MVDLHGKVALVTGSPSGVGASPALAFANRGAGLGEDRVQPGARRFSIASYALQVFAAAMSHAATSCGLHNSARHLDAA